MLVLKIKPCMCKFNNRDCEWLIITVIKCLILLCITVENLELIRVLNLDNKG